MSHRDPQNTTPNEPRPAGRSFSDPRRPLGQDILERTDPRAGDSDEGVYGRTPSTSERMRHGVADRARCISVLRKAEELMAENDPSGATAEGRDRALELACGRVGVTIEEYNRLADGDEEILSLQAAVMEAARVRSTRAT